MFFINHVWGQRFNSATLYKAVVSLNRLHVWAPNHHWVVDWWECVQRNLEFMDPKWPKLSSLDTTPNFMVLNWQWVYVLSVYRAYEFNFCQKGTVKCVPTCPRMLMYSKPCTGGLQRNQRCWNPWSFCTEVVREIHAVGRVAASCSPVGGVSLQWSHSVEIPVLGAFVHWGIYTWKEIW